MRRLPRAITGLVIYLLIIFNLERITFQDVKLIDIKGFVYVMIALSIVFIIQFDFFRRQSIGILLFISTILYFIGKYFVFYYYTNWDENTVYLIITELCFLWLAILIARIAGTAIKDFETAVESITFSDIEKTRLLDEARRDIQAEFYRSRRYNHPLTLVVVQPNTNPIEFNPQVAIEEIQNSMLSRYATVSLARELSKNLRLLDTIIDLKKNMRLAILYPQTEGYKADFLIQRINSVADNMGISVTCGHASFPNDALTFDELLRTATDNMRILPNSDPFKSSEAINEPIQDEINPAEKRY